MTGPGEEGTGGGPSQEYPGPMAYAGIGMLNAVCLMIGATAGYFIDRSAGTLPVFMLLGLLLGAGVGVIGTRAELKRYRRPG